MGRATDASTVRLSSRFPLFVESTISSGEVNLRHTEFQIFLLSDGRLRISGPEPVVLSGCSLAVVGPGGRILLSAGSVYIRIIIGSMLLERLTVEIWEDPEAEAVLAIGDGGSRAIGFPVPAETYRIIEALCQELRRIYRAADFTLARLKLMELVVWTGRSRNVASGTSISHRITWSVEDVIEYLEENYPEQFTLADIASRCAMNPTSLSRSFKEATGVPLFEYINRIRIRKACLLLKRSSRTVLEIALSVGYNNVSFFNRYFRKTMGMSPTEYRASARR
jgi:AraC-like DNA-binding protein